MSLQTKLDRSLRSAALGPFKGFIFSLVLVAMVAALDYFTGYEIRLAILYLAPIALATWSGGRRSGVSVSVVSVLCWMVSFRNTNPYSREIYYYWEGAAMVVTFIAFVSLLTRLQRALARSDERFLRVLEELFAVVYVVDDGGRVVYANQRCAALLQIDPLALRAADFEARFIAATDDSAEQKQSSGEGAIPGFVCAEIRDESNGRWYLAQTGSIPWMDNRPVRLNVLTDISEQKQSQRLRRQRQETSYHASRLMVSAEIASTLAHEINQPLMAIVSYNNACLRLLATSPPSDPRALKTAMEKCRDQALRAGQIIQRVREFIRRRQPTPTHMDLGGVLRDVIRLAETDIDRAGASIELRLADALPPALVDRMLIEQAIVNLVNNAIDAVSAVEPARRCIVIAAAATDNFIQLSVSDSGPGIPVEMKDRLFTPFFTTKPQGVGLGLSICCSIIEAHGGRLWQSDNSGGGCSFHLAIPSGVP